MVHNYKIRSFGLFRPKFERLSRGQLVNEDDERELLDHWVPGHKVKWLNDNGYVSAEGEKFHLGPVEYSAALWCLNDDQYCSSIFIDRSKLLSKTVWPRSVTFIIMEKTMSNLIVGFGTEVWFLRISIFEPVLIGVSISSAGNLPISTALTLKFMYDSSTSTSSTSLYAIIVDSRPFREYTSR